MTPSNIKSELEKVCELGQNYRGAFLTRIFFTDLLFAAKALKFKVKTEKPEDLIEVSVNERLINIVHNGFKCGTTKFQGKDTLLVIMDEFVPSKFLKEKITVSQNVFDILDKYDATLRFDYSYKYHMTIVNVVNSLFKNKEGFLFTNDIGRMPALDVNEFDKFYRTSSVDWASVFPKHIILKFYSAYELYGSYIFDNYLTNRNDIDITNIEVGGTRYFLEWLALGMPCKSHYPWYAFMTKYILGLQMAYATHCVDNEVLIDVLTATIKRFCEVIKNGIKKFDDNVYDDPDYQMCFVTRDDGFCMAYWGMHLLHQLFFMLGSLPTIENSKLYHANNTQKALEVSVEVLDLLPSFLEHMPYCTYGYSYVSEKLKKGIEKSFFTNFSYAMENFITDKVADISQIAAQIINVFGDISVVKQKMIVDQFLYEEIACTSTARKMIQNGIIRNILAAKDSECKDLITFKREKQEGESLFLGGKTSYAEVGVFRLSLTEKGLSFCNIIKTILRDSVDLNYSVFTDFTDFDIDHLDYQDANLRVYLKLDPSQRCFVQHPQDPFMKIKRTKSTDLIVTTYKDLGEVLTIERKMGLAQMELVEKALCLFGYQTFPEVPLGVKSCKNEASPLVIYQDFNNTTFKQNTIEKHIVVLCSILFKFIAGLRGLLERPKASLTPNFNISEQILINDFKNFTKTFSLDIPWIRCAIEDSNFNSKLEFAAKCYACIYENSGLESATSFLVTNSKELNGIKELLVDKDNNLFTLKLVAYFTSFFKGNSWSLPKEFATLVGELLKNGSDKENFAQMFKVNTTEVDNIFVSLLGNTTQTLKAVHSVIDILNNYCQTNVTIQNGRKTTKKQQINQNDMPVALDIDEKRLSEVLETTAKARESLNKIFADEEDEAENSQIVGVAQNISSLRHAADKTPKDESKSKPAEVKSNVSTTNKEASALNGQSNVASTKRSVASDFTREELNELLTIFKSKNEWLQSDLRRAYGKRIMMLGKFIDKLNDISLELFDDLLISVEGEDIEIEESYIDEVFANYKVAD